jgi:prophage regulatory protein
LARTQEHQNPLSFSVHPKSATSEKLPLSAVSHDVRMRHDDRTTHPDDLDDRVITTQELLRLVPLDRSTIWRLSRDGQFPKPIQLTASRIGWRLSAVRAWLADREHQPIRARRYGRAATA